MHLYTIKYLILFQSVNFKSADSIEIYKKKTITKVTTILLKNFVTVNLINGRKIGFTNATLKVKTVWKKIYQQ